MSSNLLITPITSNGNNSGNNHNTISKILPARWHLASGAISGATSVLVLQPLDLLKTRIQQDKKVLPLSISTPTTIINSNKNLGKTKIWLTTKEVIKSDGMKGLWRGTVPTLYRNVPGVSIYFLTLSKLRTIIGQTQSKYLVSSSTISSLTGSSSSTGSSNNKIKLTTTGDLLVGSTARTSVGFLLMPFTLLKTLSESTLTAPLSSSSSSTSNKPTSLSSLSTLTTLYKSGGLASLWRGAVPTALRDAPGAGLFIVFYERGRGLLGVRGDGGGGAVGGGMAGATASLLSTLLTTPFDLLKTRRQLSPEIYTSLLQSIKIVYKTSGGLRGILSFWEGGGLRVIRKAGSAGIGWAVYESVLSIGEKRGREGKISARG